MRLTRVAIDCDVRPVRKRLLDLRLSISGRNQTRPELRTIGELEEERDGLLLGLLDLRKEYSR